MYSFNDGFNKILVTTYMEEVYVWYASNPKDPSLIEPLMIDVM